jgi:glycosyltransferase involved in cell wall biosynthesis
MMISVIVPVYNSEKRLHKCIDSILGQTYTNFELLLINDGSTDTSGDICEEFAEKDERIKVYHKENGGASSARNLGIDNAKGEYICFVDSDDYVGENYLSSFLVDFLKNNKFTFVIQSLISKSNDRIIKQSSFREGLYNADNFSELFFINKLVACGGPVGKLYNKGIIEEQNIRFNSEIHFAEDLLFMLTYLLYVDSVYLSNKSNYYYISQEGSLSKKYNSFESEVLTYILLNKAFKNLVEKFQLDERAKDSFYKNNLGAQLLRAVLTTYRPENKKPRKERLRFLKELHTENNVECMDKYTQEGLKINRMGYFLYKQKQFVLFDLFYSIVYSLRYKLDEPWKMYHKRKNSKR